MIDKPKTEVWYKSSPLGIHSIETATKTLVKGLNIAADFVSNSSLRRTAMNRMIQSGLPKEVIQKKTGRVSDAADADYIAVSLFERRMSNALYNCDNKEAPNKSPPVVILGESADFPTQVVSHEVDGRVSTGSAYDCWDASNPVTVNAELPSISQGNGNTQKAHDKFIKNIFSPGCVFHGCTFN